MGEPELITKLIIPLAECAPGMILMQSIRDEETGTIIVGKNQVLTEEILNKLERFANKQIWISVRNKEFANQGIWQVSKEWIEEYVSFAQVLQSILKDATSSLSITKLVKLTDQIIDHFNEEYHILTCMQLLHELDKNEYVHSVNVASLGLALGKWVGLNRETLKEVVLAGLLHDIGKLEMNALLIQKDEEKLNGIEKLEFRRHPILGYEKLVPYNELSVEVLKGILTHHERFDGSGYPLSLKEKRIDTIARIIGISDTYDKLINRYNVFEVVQILCTKMMSKFDRDMLLQLCHNILNYYSGARVVLSNGEIGEIVFIQSKALYRPIIQVKGEYINLHEQTHLNIVKVI